MIKTKTTHDPWEINIPLSMLDLMHAKITELGGNVEEKELMDDSMTDNIVEFIRSWPTRESAQAWCDYILALPDTGIVSAEVLED